MVVVVSVIIVVVVVVVTILVLNSSITTTVIVITLLTSMSLRLVYFLPCSRRRNKRPEIHTVLYNTRQKNASEKHWKAEL